MKEKQGPNKQTIATAKYQKKAGYKVKSFKLKGDIAERFADACQKANISQAEEITRLMQWFIDQQAK